MSSFVQIYLQGLSREQRELARIRPVRFWCMRAGFVASILSLVSLAASASSSWFATNMKPGQRLRWVLVTGALIATVDLIATRSGSESTS